VRLFLAVFPPPAVRAAAHAAAEALRRAGPARASVSWVKAENLHYTLRFLGEVGEDGARRAAEAAGDAAAAVPAFDAHLGGLGAFPNPERARVLWIGLSAGAEALTALAHALDRALKPRGFGAPDHPFSPHLTLGRVREPGGGWSEALSRTPAPAGPHARFAVDRLCVVESTLSPKGSTYTVRAEAPLRGLIPPGAN
jgi:2'-5' RNA ligase